MSLIKQILIIVLLFTSISPLVAMKPGDAEEKKPKYFDQEKKKAAQKMLAEGLLLLMQWETKAEERDAVKMITQALEQGASPTNFVHYTTPHERKVWIIEPLRFALEAGSADAVRVLLEYGAPIYSYALRDAVVTNNPALVQLLIDYGDLPTIRTFHRMIESQGVSHQEKAKQRYSANVPWYSFSAPTFEEHERQNRLKIIQMLIEAGLIFKFDQPELFQLYFELDPIANEKPYIRLLLEDPDKILTWLEDYYSPEHLSPEQIVDFNNLFLLAATYYMRDVLNDLIKNKFTDIITQETLRHAFVAVARRGYNYFLVELMPLLDTTQGAWPRAFENAVLYATAGGHVFTLQLLLGTYSRLVTGSTLCKALKRAYNRRCTSCASILIDAANNLPQGETDDWVSCIKTVFAWAQRDRNQDFQNILHDLHEQIHFNELLAALQYQEEARTLPPSYFRRLPSELLEHIHRFTGGGSSSDGSSSKS